MNYNYLGICPFGVDKYRAQIFRCGRIFYLGTFNTKEAAAKAYDRATLLSSPWSKRRVAYNFDKPNADFQPSEAEQAMLDYLRSNFPGLEERHAVIADNHAQFPQALIDRASAFSHRMSSNGQELDSLIRDLRACVVSFISRASESNALIEWQKGRISELEGKLYVQGLQKDPKDPKSIFKQVAGPGFVPPVTVESVSAPAPEVQTVAAATP